MADSKVAVERVTITPDEARHLLETFSDPHKRHTRQTVIERYARDMKAGRWQFNGEAIMRNGSGQLRNGHHRLAACVLADTPFETLMVSGIDDDVMPTIDTGAARSMGDFLHWRDVPWPTDVAALANWGYRYDAMVAAGRWRMGSTGDHTRQELLDWVDRHPYAADSVLWIRTELGTGFRLPRSVLTFTHFLLARHAAPQQANQFYLDVVNLVGRPGSAVGRWRTFVGNATLSRKHTPTPMVAAAVTIKAMRFWLDGIDPPLAGLRWRQGSVRARTIRGGEPFPRIDGSVPVEAPDFEVILDYQVPRDYSAELPKSANVRARIRRSMMQRKSPWLVSDVIRSTRTAPESVRAVLQVLIASGEIVATTKRMRGAENATTFLAVDQLPDGLLT